MMMMRGWQEDGQVNKLGFDQPIKPSTTTATNDASADDGVGHKFSKILVFVGYHDCR